MGSKPKPPPGLSDAQLERLERKYDQSKKQYKKLVRQTKKESRKQNRLLTQQQDLIKRSGDKEEQAIKEQIDLQKQQYDLQQEQIAEQRAIGLIANTTAESQQQRIDAYNQRRESISRAVLDKETRQVAYKNKGLIAALTNTSLR